MLKKLLIGGAVGSLIVGTGFYAASPAMAQSAHLRTEKHPIIRKAINQLDGIEKELARADNDFKGHKEKARQLIRDAIAELHLAIKGDKH
ncbi:MAG TPA: hypothetical protein VHE55_19600 [Fimbriimonadaceae bacterium]|nr:hypothetical protein [Fimbriimonadaceae bacterium]